jgi:crossover junction endodeoxyribonuclease RuvC
MICVGIDVGLSGAIAFFDIKAGALSVFDMPVVEVLRGGKKKKEVCARSLAHMFRDKANADMRIFIERVNAMSGQGVTSVFSFGRSAGVVDGVVSWTQAQITLITPQVWQKAVGVRDGKDGSRLRAMELFPAYSELFRLKKAHGRSDAALISYYGAMK